MFQINGKGFTRPDNFVMKRKPHLAAQLKTLSGRTIGDIRGWKYEDATLKWGCLPESAVEELLVQTAGGFTIRFDDLDGEREANAVCTSFGASKAFAVKNSAAVYTDFEMEVEFIDVFHN